MSVGTSHLTTATDVDFELTGLPNSLIIKPRLAHRKGMPVRPVDLLIRVDHIQVLIHPQLVTILAHEHGPMLRRVRVPVDLFRDHLAQTSLLSEPLARQPGNRMPSYLNDAQRTVGQGLIGRYDIWLVAQPERDFKLLSALNKRLFAFYHSLGYALLPAL